MRLEKENESGRMYGKKSEWRDWDLKIKNKKCMRVFISISFGVTVFVHFIYVKFFYKVQIIDF